MPNPLERRLLRVIDHIHRNPAGDLSLDALAEIAAMSRFHWHRCCRVLTGETVAQHVRRIGLERAAMPLIGTPDRVARIARAVGDPNAASFARAFGDRLGRATTAFRRRGLPPDTHLPPALKAFTMFPVEIMPRPALRLAALEHRGDDNRIGESFAKLSAHLAANGPTAKVRGSVGVYQDNPAETPEPALRSHADALVDKDFVIAAPLVEIRLPAGRAAVLHHQGPYSTLAACDQLYCDRLPKSGQEPGDTPVYEVDLNTPPTPPPRRCAPRSA